MISRPHWSYSQLAQYLRCPLQYFFERIAKLPRPFVPSGMALGSAVHHALAVYHRQLLLGTLPSSQEIQAEFLNAWNSTETNRPVQYGNGEKKSALLEQGAALIAAYVDESPPQNILAIEEPLMVPIHNSHGEFLEKPLLAIVDLMTREPDGLVVTDFKTSARRYSEADAATGLQVTLRACHSGAIRRASGLSVQGTGQDEEATDSEFISQPNT